MTLNQFAKKSVITVSSKESVLEAAKAMRDHHIGSVLVVDKAGARPVGILTDRDIVMSVVAQEKAPGDTPVAAAMTPGPVLLESGDTLTDALKVMKERGVKRVGVLGRGGAVEGIVSSDDVLAALTAQLGDLSHIREKQHEAEHRRTQVAA